MLVPARYYRNVKEGLKVFQQNILAKVPRISIQPANAKANNKVHDDMYADIETDED